jgi:ATPase subunit of ABC transporter with duplicated ATPase domains
VIDYRRLKEKARNPATIQQFKRLESNAKTELAKLQESERPNFWVDAESVGQMGYKDLGRYGKYKAKNVRFDIRSKDDKSQKVLLAAKNLVVGYDEALFEDKTFELREGEVLEIQGRNGAGKTTLVKALLGEDGPTIFAGETHLDAQARVGIYQQEVDKKYFKLRLPEAIEQIYRDQDLFVPDQRIRQLLGDYLFEEADTHTLVGNLSGGQKARLQTIAMLAGDPNLLILDEPTSHLDLPSIEELESALTKYHGAVLYISHDGYFREKIGGEVVEIG